MGRTLTPQQEIEQLKAVIREGHETIKELRGQIREARKLTTDLLTAYQQTVNDEIKSLGNWLRLEHNRISAELNANVAEARIEIMRQLSVSELERDPDTDTLRLYFKAGRFDDQLPLPHPNHPIMEIPE